MCDDHAALFRVLPLHADIVRDSLRRAPDRKLVHAVRTDADDTPKSSRAELQVLNEPLTDLLLIALKRLKLASQSSGSRKLFLPFLKPLCVIHLHTSSVK